MEKALMKFRGVTDIPVQLDLLRSLAGEIALVAEAAQEGCSAHVVGRAHLKCAVALHLCHVSRFLVTRAGHVPCVLVSRACDFAGSILNSKTCTAAICNPRGVFQLF